MLILEVLLDHFCLRRHNIAILWDNKFNTDGFFFALALLMFETGIAIYDTALDLNTLHFKAANSSLSVNIRTKNASKTLILQAHLYTYIYMLQRVL